MEEVGDPNNKKEIELGNEDAEEGEIIDDDEEDESQQQQQLQSTTTPIGVTGTTTFTNSSSSTASSSSLISSIPSTTTTTPTTAFSFGNQGDKSGSGLISGLSHSSASGNNTSSRSSSERNKKDENRSSSKKSDSKKSNNSTNSGSSSASTGTSINSNNNSTSGAGTSSSSRNNSSDKRKRRKYGKDEEGGGKEQPDKESGSSKDHLDDNGLRPSKQRRATSREPGEANDTGSSEESDRTDSDDDSVDFNEEFFKGMVKQMEEMLKSGKDKGQRKKREKIEKMMEKLKRLQSGSDTREMREIVRQNRRLFRPSSRDRSRDRFDRFGPRGFRDRRGAGGRGGGGGGGRMRERTMIWRERDRDRRDFRDRDRDRDRDRFRDRDKMMGTEQPYHHHHHHHHHHQSHSSNQLQSQTSQQQQSTQAITPTAAATTSTTATTTTTTNTTTTTATPSIDSATLTTTSSTPTSTPSSTTVTTASSQNPAVVNQNETSKENDREREKSPKNTCRFYLDGKCHKGAECTFPHDLQPAKKKDICKFYLQGFCGKGEGCLFMHGEFPCKFYHTGAECYSGDKCRFSHEPLTEETRALLKNYLDSGELPDEVNRGAEGGGGGSGANQARLKKPAVLGDPTEEMKTSYFTWLWQQEMKELELAYTGTKRNLFLIEKEFAIIEQPPQPEGDPHPYYRVNDKMDMRQHGLDSGGGGGVGGSGPKVLSYYIDTMSEPSLKCDPKIISSVPVNNEDDKLIEMSFHDEDLRLPPSSGVIPPRLPPPMGAPGPAPVDPTPFPGIPSDHLSSPSKSLLSSSSSPSLSSTSLPMTPHHHQPNLNSVPPFDSQQQHHQHNQALTLSMPPPPVHSNNNANNSTPSSLTTMIPSGPPPLLPMQPKLMNTNNEQSSSSSSFVNNNQFSTLSTHVMPEEMPLPPLKENLPPGPYQESSSNLGPPPPLYAVNSFNGPSSVAPVETNFSLSSTSNQTVNLSSVQSTGHDNINQLAPNFNPISQHHQQHDSSFVIPQDPMESARAENSSSIPDNLPLAARHLLQRISNNQKFGTPEDNNESDDLPFNESNIKKEIVDSSLRQPSEQLMTKPMDDTNSGEMKQLLSDSDDDTEDEPVKAALKNLKDAPNTTPPPPMKHESKKDKNVKSKLDIVKMLNVIRQTTLQVASTQPVANTSDENKHADFWQNILSGTNLANNNSSAVSLASVGTGSNSGIDFRDSRTLLPPGSETPPSLPGTERRDPRLKRSSNDGDGNSPYQDFTSNSNKQPEVAFKSDFDYRLYPMTAPKIDYSIYEELFNIDVRMKTDPRLLNFFKKNTLKDYNPLG